MLMRDNESHKKRRWKQRMSEKIYPQQQMVYISQWAPSTHISKETHTSLSFIPSTSSCTAAVAHCMWPAAWGPALLTGSQCGSHPPCAIMAVALHCRAACPVHKHTPIAQQQPNHQCVINTASAETRARGRCSAVLAQVTEKNYMHFDTVSKHSPVNSGK